MFKFVSTDSLSLLSCALLNLVLESASNDRIEGLENHEPNATQLKSKSKKKRSVNARKSTDPRKKEHKIEVKMESYPSCNKNMCFFPYYLVGFVLTKNLNYFIFSNI